MLKRPLIRLQCYEGLDLAGAAYEWNYARQMLEIRLAEATGVARDRLAADLFSERFLIRRALLQAIDPGGAGAAGAADRRARPRRRAVRGVPAGGAVGLPDHDSRVRHHQGEGAADRRADVATARAKYTTPSSGAASITGSAFPTPSASTRSCNGACPARRRRCRARSSASSRRCATSSCSSCRASPKRSSGPARCSSSTRWCWTPKS